jgi:hypothetical protein
MSDDYLFKAADTVRRKSLAALEVQSNAEAVMRSHAVGLADGAQHQSGDPALAAETERALAQSLAALDEIANQDGKENKRDG